MRTGRGRQYSQTAAPVSQTWPAASIAGMILTTEAVVTEKPEEEEKEAASAG